MNRVGLHLTDFFDLTAKCDLYHGAFLYDQKLLFLLFSGFS